MANLKLATSNQSPRSAERAKLAETIAKIHEAEARIADNAARINSLFDKAFFAQEAADNAFANIEKARQAQLDYLADSSLPAPSMTLIEATPSTGATTFIADRHGLPMVSRSFARWFAEACKAAGVLKGRAHGLRKAAATRAAEHGATAAQLESIFAWRGGRMASLYTRQADRAKLARDAMEKLLTPHRG